MSTEVLIPLLCALFTLLGVVVAKLIDFAIKRNSAKISNEGKFRGQLMKSWETALNEIQEAQQKTGEVEKEVEGWREKYHELREEHYRLKVELDQTRESPYFEQAD